MLSPRKFGAVFHIASGRLKANFGRPHVSYYLRAVKDYQFRNFSKTAGRTPIFEVRIVIYDQKCLYNHVFKTLATYSFPKPQALLTFSPSRALLAAMA